MQIRKIEFEKKVILKYDISVYAHSSDLSVPLLVKNIPMKVRYNKGKDEDTKFLSLIPIKDRIKQILSMKFGIKMHKIFFLYKHNYEYENYKLSSFPTSIVIMDSSWVRDYKLEKLLEK